MRRPEQRQIADATEVILKEAQSLFRRVIGPGEIVSYYQFFLLMKDMVEFGMRSRGHKNWHLRSDYLRNTLMSNLSRTNFAMCGRGIWVMDGPVHITQDLKPEIARRRRR